MREKIVGIVVAVEFFLMIAIPLITFDWKQGQKSIAENRYLASFPTFFNENGELSETLSEDLANWFEDHIGLRDTMINLSSIISFNIFHQPTSDRVEIGRDGWLFYTDENNLKIASQTYPDFGKEQLEEYCRQQMEIQKKLASQGIEYVFVIPASKASVYPEYIQSGDYSIQETPADIFADYLESHSDIHVIRLKDAMLEEKNRSDKLLYFKTDTHWNRYGGYVGYRKIIEDMNAWGMIDTKPVDAEFYESGPYSGDLAGMMGVVNFKGQHYSEDQYLEKRLVNNKAAKVTEGDRFHRFASFIQKKGIQDGSVWENTAVDGKRVLIYGDSMIGTCILPELAENFSELTFNWTYRLDQEMIDFIQPDIVMLDVSERGLNIYLEELNSYLKTDIHFDKENRTLDIYYHDGGELKEMYFPTWSEENGQDDLIWYKAERSDDNSWHVRVDLGDHMSDGNFDIHFYDGSADQGKYVDSATYDVGALVFN